MDEADNGSITTVNLQLALLLYCNLCMRQCQVGLPLSATFLSDSSGIDPTMMERLALHILSCSGGVKDFRHSQ